jgi:hypothetical protein
VRALAAVTVIMRLSNGELVQLDPVAQEDVYEQLWRQAQRGAITDALKLRDGRVTRRGERLVRLNDEESSALREALARVDRREPRRNH